MVQNGTSNYVAINDSVGNVKLEYCRWRAWLTKKIYIFSRAIVSNGTRPCWWPQSSKTAFSALNRRNSYLSSTLFFEWDGILKFFWGNFFFTPNPGQDCIQHSTMFLGEQNWNKWHAVNLRFHMSVCLQDVKKKEIKNGSWDVYITVVIT